VSGNLISLVEGPRLIADRAVVAEAVIGIATMEAWLGMLPACRQRAERGEPVVHGHA
jgi:hypothetical protein